MVCVCTLVSICSGVAGYILDARGTLLFPGRGGGGRPGEVNYYGQAPPCVFP